MQILINKVTIVAVLLLDFFSPYVIVMKTIGNVEAIATKICLVPTGSWNRLNIVHIMIA